MPIKKKGLLMNTLRNSRKSVRCYCLYLTFALLAREVDRNDIQTRQVQVIGESAVLAVD